jgi:hypothetical protein
MQLICFLQVVCMHLSRESCIGSGELFVVFELWLVICALCLIMVLSRMCRAVALA